MSETRAESIAGSPFVAPSEVAVVAAVVICCASAVATATAPLASAIGVSTMIPAALVDLRVGRLPDRLVALAAAAFATGAVASVLGGGSVSATEGLVGAVVVAGPLFVIHLVGPDAMGFGDVKAALVLGAALGVAHPVVALVGLTAASAVGALWGVLSGRRTVPFGPALVVGAAIALAVADGGGVR